MKSILGQYEDGILTGKGKVTMKDETIREGWFQHGFFHGPVRYTRVSPNLPHLIVLCRGSSVDGWLEFLGYYRAGLASGMVWRRMRGGGWLVGCVDNKGNHTGEDCPMFNDNDFAAEPVFGSFQDIIDR